MKPNVFDSLTIDSDTLYQLLFKQSSKPIFIVDTLRLQIVEANNAAVRLTGQPVDRLASKPIDEVIPFHGIADPAAAISNAVGTEAGVHTEIKSQDGEILSYEISVRSTAGSEILMLVFRDISDDIEEYRQYKRAKEQFRYSLDMMPLGAALIRADGIYKYLNPAFTQMLGYTIADIPDGRTWFRRAYPEKKQRSRMIARWKEEIKTIAAPAEMKSDIYQVIDKAGATKSIRFRPVMLDGGDFLVIYTDVTERIESELRLRQSEERFRSLSEATFEGVFIHRNGVINEINDTGCEMFGYRREEIIGMSVLDLAADVSKEEVVEKVRSGTSETYQAIGLRKDGSTFHGEIRGKNFGPYEDGLRVVTIHDISAQVKAEQSLRESEQRFRTAFLTSPESININRLSDGLFVDINEGFTATTGYTAADVAGKTSSELDVWAEADGCEKFINQLSAKGFVANEKTLFRRKDGKTVVGLISAKKINLNGEAHILSVTRDISDLDLAEERLRKSEQRFRDAAGLATDLVYEQNLKTGEINYFGNMDKHMGLPPNRFPRTRQGWIEHLHPEDRNEIVPMFDIAVEPVKVREIEYRLIGADDRIVWWHDRFMIIQDRESSARGRIIGVATNITEQKKIEQERLQLVAQLHQAAKLESIGLLAGGVAHDFNNLLTSILGYANLLKIKAKKGTIEREAAQTIETAAERAGELTAQLLGFARKGKNRIAPVNIHSSIDEIFSLLSRTFDKNIVIKKNLDAHNSMVEGDPAQLQQVLMNLAINARDAMADGGILSIDTEMLRADEEFCSANHAATPGLYLKISVTDTGCGIESENLDKIFDPFFTTKGIGQGTGMGLAMVYGIVSNHDGFIDVSSESGVGAQFNVFLPSLIGGKPIDEATEDQTISGFGSILVVDDEASILDTLNNLLGELGYKVFGFAFGSEAISFYQQNHKEIDLAIVDMIMPVLDGAAVIEQLQKINPKLPVILSTGYSVDGKAQQILDNGAVALLQKPYRLEQLSRTVHLAMEKKS